MNAKQMRIVIGITLAVVAGWLTAPYWGGADAPDVAVSQTPLQFDAGQALETAREFVTGNPRRVLGSLESRQATGYLQDRLQRLGYQVSFSHFDAVLAGRRQLGRNVLAYRQGSLPGILAVVAHYDTARTTLQGAMDNGAGIGVLLQLARVFAGSPLRHSLLVIASDGEEWGMLGAADVARNHAERQRIRAILSLDWVAAGDLAALTLGTQGQRSGTSPSWLRRIALQAAQVEGLPVDMPSGFREAVERAIPFSLTDQGPFLHAGIPAINLGSISADEARMWRIYHSEEDTIDNLKPASIAMYGAVAERILRSLDGLPAADFGMDEAFRWGGDAYVGSWAVKLLQYLAFLPFLVMLGIGWMRLWPGPSPEKALRDISIFLTCLVPFALFYSLVLFCRLMRLLPQNSYYPGPLRDPMLAQPPWGLLGGIAGASLAAGLGLYFLVRYLTRGQMPSYRESKLMQMTLLFPVVLLSLLHNPYGAVTFLAFPALIWGAVGRGKKIGTRIAGALMIPAAGFALFLAAIAAARSLQAGWDILWYAVLGLSTGMLHWKGYFLAASAAVLGMRFLALQFSRRPE
jgi:hypothetical protein